MKKLFFLALCVLAGITVFGKDADGYIILPNKDTIWVKIKVPGGIFGGYDINKKLKVVDSAAKETEYTPDQLKGFGYTDKHGKHDYRTKPIQDSVGHPFFFLEVLVDGPKACLYDYWITVGAGNTQSVEVFYTFEKPDGTVLYLKNYDKLSTLQDKLKAFYGDTPAMQAFIDARFEGRGKIQKDIKAIVEEVNK